MRLRPLILIALFAIPALGAAQSSRMRIMAANTTSGNNQSYLAPGERIFQALQPDIVLIQEFNIGSDASTTTVDTDAFVDRVFGTEYSWAREPGDDQIPNGVISRWPILESGQWADPEVSNRDFAYARIDIPGPIDLWAVSVHFLTSSSTDRNAEASALISAMNSHPVPSGDYLVIGGDFNTGSRSESALSTLSAAVITSGPYPADQDGDSDTNANRNEPYDWVLVDSGLDPFEIAVSQGTWTFNSGLVFDTRLFSQAQLDASFSPALVSDSDASSMQHMAVVRDFTLPTSDLSVAPTAIDFATVDADLGPFDNSDVTISIFNPVTVSSPTLSGSHPGEFTLISPSLPAALTSDTDLTFRWTPAANDNQARTVTATFTTDGEPSEFQISLTGRTSNGGSGTGDPLDVSGYQIDMVSSSTLSVTLPATTVLEPGDLVVIGRSATQTAFEAFHGALGSEVHYFNGMDLVGGNGWPIINSTGKQFAVRDDGGVQIDPPTGLVPDTATGTDISYQRDSTGGVTFTGNPEADANPGVFTGTLAQTGGLVITEISDASSFEYEFVELIYDAVVTSDPEPVGITLR